MDTRLRSATGGLAPLLLIAATTRHEMWLRLRSTSSQVFVSADDEEPGDRTPVRTDGGVGGWNIVESAFRHWVS